MPTYVGTCILLTYQLLCSRCSTRLRRQDCSQLPTWRRRSTSGRSEESIAEVSLKDSRSYIRTYPSPRRINMQPWGARTPPTPPRATAIAPVPSWRATTGQLTSGPQTHTRDKHGWWWDRAGFPFPGAISGGKGVPRYVHTWTVVDKWGFAIHITYRRQGGRAAGRASTPPSNHFPSPSKHPVQLGGPPICRSQQPE